MGWAYERRQPNFRRHCTPLDLSLPSPEPSTVRQTTRKSLYEAIFSGPTKYACCPELSPDWDPEEEEQQPENYDPEEYIKHLRLQDEVEKKYQALHPVYLNIQTKEQQAELERYKKTFTKSTLSHQEKKAHILASYK